MPSDVMSPAMLNREATGRSPAIDFDFAQAHLSIRGKSYPEDAVAFYVPLLNTVSGWLQSLAGATVTVDIALRYFNSSSAKALSNMLMMLDEAAQRDNAVVVNWHYLHDDEMMREYGEEFAEDLEKVAFRLVPTDEA